MLRVRPYNGVAIENNEVRIIFREFAYLNAISINYRTLPAYVLTKAIF